MNITHSSSVSTSRYLTSVLGVTIFILGGTELLTVLDGTVVTLALPSMENYFHILPIDAIWVIITYILFFSGFLMLGGRLGDVFSRKKVFILGVGIIVIASLYSGFTHHFIELLCARALQAMGAAIAAPTAMAYVASLYEPGKIRTLAFSIYGAMMGLGSVLALTVGGLLATSSWRWVFWINVPIGGAIVIAGCLALPNAIPGDRDTKIFTAKDLDYWGFVTAFIACFGIAMTIYIYSRIGMEHNYVLYTLVATVISCILFIVVESRARFPIFPARLLLVKNRAFAMCVNTLAGGVMTCMAVFVARYLQEVVHYTPFKSGLAVLPFAGGMGLAMVISPILTQKIAPRWIIIASGVLLLIVLLIVHSYVHHYPGYFPLFFMAVGSIGCGVGLILTSILLSVFADVDIDDTGAISAMQKISMEIGGGICLALVTGMQNTTIRFLSQSTRFAHCGDDWILSESFGYVVYGIIGIILCAGLAVFCMTYTPAQISHGIAIKSAADSGIVADELG